MFMVTKSGEEKALDTARIIKPIVMTMIQVYNNILNVNRINHKQREFIVLQMTSTQVYVRERRDSLQKLLMSFSDKLAMGKEEFNQEIWLQGLLKTITQNSSSKRYYRPSELHKTTANMCLTWPTSWPNSQLDTSQSQMTGLLHFGFYWTSRLVNWPVHCYTSSLKPLLYVFYDDGLARFHVHTHTQPHHKQTPSPTKSTLSTIDIISSSNKCWIRYPQ